MVRSESHCSLFLSRSHPKLYKELIQAYPRLFKLGSDPDFKNKVKVPKAWLPLIHSLCLKLEAAIENVPDKIQSDFYIIQIKEKFGGLRVYMNRKTDEMERMIHETEVLSLVTCEFCGNHAEYMYPPYRKEVRTKIQAWHQTVCKKHYLHRLRKDGWDKKAPRGLSEIFKTYIWFR